MTFSQKMSLLSKASNPGRDWISGWRVLRAYEVSTEKGVEEKVFIRNLMQPTDKKPSVDEECECEFTAYWSADTREWLLENTEN